MTRLGAAHPLAVAALAMAAQTSSACAGAAKPRPAPTGPSAKPGAGGIDAELGERPRYLVASLRDGPLKKELESCAGRPLRPTPFSIGHRGAALGYPEHTKESYEAAARMGAGIIECDVTFTKDRELVCRHSQCDLHTTTNVLETPLAAKCSVPFTPEDPKTGKDASAECCTSDLTLAEFETLCGKMDGFDPNAQTAVEYVHGPSSGAVASGTAAVRGVTDVAKGSSAARGGATACAKVMSHAESIALIDRLGRSFAPELKAPSVPTSSAGGYDPKPYVRRLVDEYTRARVAPERVFLQSANLRDLEYLRSYAPRFAQNAVYLDETVDEPAGYARAVARLPGLRARGIGTVAPPLWALVTLDVEGRIAPSTYAVAAKQSGLELLTWTLERSGRLERGGGYYYQSVSPAITNDGDVYVVLDVLARRVGVRGVFSDWPATVTYYADCMGL